MTRTGVWMIGARGNVATTATVGARAIARGAIETTGMVTARDPCTDLDLPAVDEFVFGGHDIRRVPVVDVAASLAEEDVLPLAAYEAAKDDLNRVDDRIRTGTAINCGRAVDLADEDPLERDLSLSAVVEQIRSDFEEFYTTQDVDRLVVVNLASTEPTITDADRYAALDAFESALENDDRSIPASSLYAYAALTDGHPYVNFTPSTGSALGGLQELADEANVPHMGRDAKTGETLVKSALAPMFAGRNLRVRSWEGHNILGNDDGLVLEDDTNKVGKLESKGGVLEGILGADLHNRVRIDYTPSLGDWKTAWDYIHFEGFMGTEMKMQFTWEGADSALAAPLVLDLVRLVAYADEQGEGGLQPHLASFFKAPMGVDEHDLSRQFAMLDAYVGEHVGESGDGRSANVEATDD